MDSAGRNFGHEFDGLVECVHAAQRSLGLGHAASALLGLHAFDSLSISVAGYATYFIVKAECEIALGAFEDAHRSLKTALKLSPNSARPALLLEALPAMQLPSTSIERPKKLTLELLLDDEEPQAKRPQSGLPAQNVLFDIEAVATRLSAERPIVRPFSETSSHASPSQARRGQIHANDVGTQNEELGLVSETLATIMTTQGKLDDARKVYIQLSRLHPHRFDHYTRCIDELDRIARDAPSHGSDHVPPRQEELTSPRQPKRKSTR